MVERLGEAMEAALAEVACCAGGQPPALDREAMLAFLGREFPGAGFGDRRPVLAEYERRRCRLVMPFDPVSFRLGPRCAALPPWP